MVGCVYLLMSKVNTFNYKNPFKKFHIPTKLVINQMINHYQVKRKKREKEEKKEIDL